MIASPCSGTQIIKPKTLRASSASLQVAKRIIRAASGKQFYVLMTYLPAKKVFNPMHMIIEEGSDKPELLFSTNVTS